MTIFIFLLYAAPLPFFIANPGPETRQIEGRIINKAQSEELSRRLQIATMSFLVIGAFAFILTLCLVLFENQWVTRIVSKFPKNSNDDQGRHENGHIALPEVDNQENPTRAFVGADDTQENDEEDPADVANVAVDT